MIIRLWLLTLLVAQLALGFDHSIDLKRCDKAAKDTACLIRESCIKDKTDSAKLVFYKKQELADENYCDAIIQIKVMNIQMMHVMMQAKSTSGELKLTDGLRVDQEVMQFHCKPEKTIGKSGWTIATAGRQTFNKNEIFCSFTLRLGGTEVISGLNIASLTSKPVFVISKTTGDDKITYVKPKADMWTNINGYGSCEYSTVSSSDKHGTAPDIEWMEVDTTLTTLTCKSGPLIIKESGNEESVTKVFCDAAFDSKEWKKETNSIISSLGDDFEVYCPEKTCLQCTKATIPSPPSSCTDCTDLIYTPPPTDRSTCPTLTCPVTFTFDGSETFAGTAECKRSTDTAKFSFSWWMGGKERKEAACMLEKEKIPCGPRYDPMKHTCYPNTTPKDAVRMKGLYNVDGADGNTISCKDPEDDLLVVQEHNRTATKEIKCDFATGKFKFNGTLLESFGLECKNPNAPPPGPASDKIDPLVVSAIVGGTLLLVACVLGGYCLWLRSKKEKKASAGASSKKQASANKTAEAINNKSASSAASTAPGDAVDTSENRKKSSSKRSKRDSKKSKRDKKLKLDDHQTWDNETFTKKILPNFKTCDAESKTRWLRDTLCRFYAYSNTKKAPESGTFNQFWLLVKQCADDKCEDAGVWVELFNICFLIGYSIAEKNEHTDSLRGHYMKPLENYMLEYLKKCDVYKRKDEPRAETEMRVICIMVLLHTRHPDVTETLRKLTFNEKLEVPLRMLTAACYTRERDDKGKTVHAQYKRLIDSSVLDPHAAEGWGSYLQHCAFGLGGYLITQTETTQFQFFDAIYQFPLQKDPEAARIFSPSDWLYGYKGALMHENSAKIALDIFKKMNNGCLLHIDTLLKQKHKDDADEMEKHRDQYRKDMKEYTQLLSELIIGEEEFNDFKSHLHFVLLFIGDHAKTGEPLSEDRIRERAINMQNMLRDRNFAKECVESLKAIGSKEV